MITVITSFKLDSSITPEKARQLFADSAPKFLNKEGLLRKFFLLSEDATAGAAVYLWEDRQHAEAFFTEAWKQFIQGKYGYLPEVAYYECPVEVDNIQGIIKKVD